MNLLCGMCGQVHKTQYAFLKCLKAHGGEHIHSAEQVIRRNHNHSTPKDLRRREEMFNPDLIKIFD